MKAYKRSEDFAALTVCSNVNLMLSMTKMMELVRLSTHTFAVLARGFCTDVTAFLQPISEKSEKTSEKGWGSKWC